MCMAPKTHWTVTPTLRAEFQLLCMFKTNPYICFCSVFSLGRQKMVASALKNRICFQSPGSHGLTWTNDEEEQIDEHSFEERGSQKGGNDDQCGHRNASTQTDRISLRVETSRRLCLVQLEHIEIYTLDQDIQALQQENYFRFPPQSVIARKHYLNHNIAVKTSCSQDGCLLTRWPLNSLLHAENERSDKPSAVAAFISS